MRKYVTEDVNSKEELAKELAELGERRIINPDNFKEIYPEENISRDKKYVNKMEIFFDPDSWIGVGHTYRPKAFESIATHNISSGAWLSDPNDPTRKTTARGTSRYDDVVNRIDAIVYSKSEELGDFVYGLDMTTNSDEDDIAYKIIYNSNDREFTGEVGTGQIKYFIDNDNNAKSTQVIPRFCIGVSGDTVDTLLEKTRVLNNKVPNTLEHDFVTQYKILTELTAQTQLFIKRLNKKEENETITDEEDKTLNQLLDLDYMFQNDLERTMKLLPTWTKHFGSEAPQINAQLIRGQEGRSDHCFETIIKVVEKLDKALDEDENALDELLNYYREGDEGKSEKQAPDNQQQEKDMGETINNLNQKLSNSTTIAS